VKIVRTLICYGLRQVIGDLANNGVEFVVGGLGMGLCANIVRTAGWSTAYEDCHHSSTIFSTKSVTIFRCIRLPPLATQGHPLGRLTVDGKRVTENGTFGIG
jgi:hypothetical protein